MTEIIDLSHQIHSDMPVYPGTNPPIITEACSIETHGFKESLISFYSHTGTHLDVPAHLFPQGKSVDKFDCSKFFGTAILTDCKNKKFIGPGIISDAYKKYGPADFILFNTGWDQYWNMTKYFEGFPVLTNEAAEYVASLHVKGIGIDSISFDPVNDRLLSNHKIFMNHDIILVENLCCLNKIKHNQFLFSCLPLNITGADGSPTRAFAII